VLRLLAPLFGFAVFGALFAGVYYAPDEVERELQKPKFRLAPGDAKPDFIEPADIGENVSVNISVLSGGPIDVWLVDVVNLTLFSLNATHYGFDVTALADYASGGLSKANVTRGHNFTFGGDGANRWAILLVSRVAAPVNWTDLPDEEREGYVTEIAVTMRYLERETKSLVFGALLAVPSVVLVGMVLYRSGRRRGPRGAPPLAPEARDEGL